MVESAKMNNKIIDYTSERKWVFDNQESLRKKYNGSYIAVRDCQVVYDHDQLIVILERVENEGIKGAVIGTIDTLIMGLK